MKIKNFILDNDYVYDVLKKFMGFRMSIATVFLLDPIFEKCIDTKKKIQNCKMKAYEKYANPVFDVAGNLIRYTVDGCSEENKIKLNDEIRDLLNGETEIGDRITVDLNKVEGNVNKEELVILKSFFDFMV